jgi:hypothetical protein
MAATMGVTSTPTDGGDETSTQGAGTFNYYFVFLAIGAVIVAVSLCWCHRRKEARKQQLRRGGHEALERDIEGWAGTRRFMHGRYGQTPILARSRAQEGLNENGEAPPPYEPKSDAAVVAEPAVPLRTLSRNEIDRTGPPGYSADTVRP